MVLSDGNKTHAMRRHTGRVGRKEESGQGDVYDRPRDSASRGGAIDDPGAVGAIGDRSIEPAVQSDLSIERESIDPRMIVLKIRSVQN